MILFNFYQRTAKEGTKMSIDRLKGDIILMIESYKQGSTVNHGIEIQVHSEDNNGKPLPEPVIQVRKQTNEIVYEATLTQFMILILRGKVN